MRRSKSLSCLASARSIAASVLIAGMLPGSALAESCTQAAGDVGTIWWAELVSANTERSRDFYASIAGWTPKTVSAVDAKRPPAPGEGEYTLFLRNNTEVAGMSKYEGKVPNETRPGWMTYIQVASVDDAVLEVLKKGGKILKAPYDDADAGRVAIVEDPDGFAVGLVKPITTTPIQ